MIRKRTAWVMAIAAAVALTASKSGSPGQRTGSTFDGQTCATSQCHGSQIPIRWDLISTNIPSSGFEADSTYIVTVYSSRNNGNTYGFEIMAEDDAGQPTGRFTGNDSVEVFNASLRATHKITSVNGDGFREWKMEWKAPSGARKVRFHAASVAANGNGNNFGDTVLIDSMSVFADQLASVLDIEEKLSLYPLPASTELHTGLQRAFKYQILDLNGRVILQGTAIERIAIAGLKDGLYVLLLESEGRYMHAKFLKGES